MNKNMHNPVNAIDSKNILRSQEHWRHEYCFTGASVKVELCDSAKPEDINRFW